MSLNRIKSFLNKKYKSETENDEDILLRKKWNEYLQQQAVIDAFKNNYNNNSKDANKSNNVNRSNFSNTFASTVNKTPAVISNKKNIKDQNSISSTSSKNKKKTKSESESESDNETSEHDTTGTARSVSSTSEENMQSSDAPDSSSTNINKNKKGNNNDNNWTESDDSKKKSSDGSDDDDDDELNETKSLNNSMNSSFKRYQISIKRDKIDKATKEIQKDVYNDNSAKSLKNSPEKKNSMFKDMIRNAFRLPNSEVKEKKIETEDDDEETEEETEESESDESEIDKKESNSSHTEKEDSETENHVSEKKKDNNYDDDDDDDDEEEEEKEENTRSSSKISANSDTDSDKGSEKNTSDTDNESSDDGKTKTKNGTKIEDKDETGSESESESESESSESKSLPKNDKPSESESDSDSEDEKSESINKNKSESETEENEESKTKTPSSTRTSNSDDDEDDNDETKTLVDENESDTETTEQMEDTLDKRISIKKEDTSDDTESENYHASNKVNNGTNIKSEKRISKPEISEDELDKTHDSDKQKLNYSSSSDSSLGSDIELDKSIYEETDGKGRPLVLSTISEKTEQKTEIKDKKDEDETEDDDENDNDDSLNDAEEVEEEDDEGSEEENDKLKNKSNNPDLKPLEITIEGLKSNEKKNVETEDETEEAKSTARSEETKTEETEEAKSTARSEETEEAKSTARSEETEEAKSTARSEETKTEETKEAKINKNNDLEKKASETEKLTEKKIIEQNDIDNHKNETITKFEVVDDKKNKYEDNETPRIVASLHSEILDNDKTTTENTSRDDNPKLIEKEESNFKDNDKNKILLSNEKKDETTDDEEKSQSESSFQSTLIKDEKQINELKDLKKDKNEKNENINNEAFDEKDKEKEKAFIESSLNLELKKLDVMHEIKTPKEVLPKAGILKSNSTNNISSRDEKTVRIAELERVEHEFEINKKEEIQQPQHENQIKPINVINNENILLKENENLSENVSHDEIIKKNEIIEEMKENKLEIKQEPIKKEVEMGTYKSEPINNELNKEEPIIDKKENNSFSPIINKIPIKPESPSKVQSMFKRFFIKSPTRQYKGAKINIVQNLEKPIQAVIKTPTSNNNKKNSLVPSPPKQPINTTSRNLSFRKTQVSKTSSLENNQLINKSKNKQPTNAYTVKILEPSSNVEEQSDESIDESIIDKNEDKIDKENNEHDNKPVIIKVKPVNKPLFIEYDEVKLTKRKENLDSKQNTPKFEANKKLDNTPRVEPNDSKKSTPRQPKFVRINDNKINDDKNIYDPDDDNDDDNSEDRKKVNKTLVFDVKKKSNINIDINQIFDKKNSIPFSNNNNTVQRQSFDADKKNEILKELKREATLYKPLLNKNVTQLILKSPEKGKLSKEQMFKDKVGITILSEMTPQSIEIKFKPKKEEQLATKQSKGLKTVVKSRSNEEINMNSKKSIKKKFSNKETKRTRGDLDNNGFETPIYSKLMKPLMQREQSSTTTDFAKSSNISVLTNQSFDIPNILDNDNELNEIDKSNHYPRLPLSSPIPSKQEIYDKKEYSASYENLKKLEDQKNTKISAKIVTKEQNTKSKKIRRKSFLTRDYVPKPDVVDIRAPNSTPLEREFDNDKQSRDNSEPKTPRTIKKKKFKKPKVFRTTRDSFKKSSTTSSEMTNTNKLIDLKLKMATNTTSTTTVRTPRYTNDNESEFLKRHDYLRRSYPSPPKSPYTAVSRSALNYTATDRLIELSRPKSKKDNLIREEFPKDRYDPLFSGVLNRSALSFAPTQRIEELSKPKSVCDSYRFSRPLPDLISSGAKIAEPSIRLIELAKPKHNY